MSIAIPENGAREAPFSTVLATTREACKYLEKGASQYGRRTSAVSLRPEIVGYVRQEHMESSRAA